MQSTCLERIAVFIDYESIKGDPPRKSGEVIRAIRKDLESAGVIQMDNIYFAMGLPDSTPVERAKIYQAYEEGADPIAVPSFQGNGGGPKNLADGEAMVDIIDTLHTRPEITAYCIGTNDKDFLPAIRKLAGYGKSVRLYYNRTAANVLRQFVDSLSKDGFSRCVDLSYLLERSASV